MRGGTGGMSGRSGGGGRLMQIELTKLLALAHYETGSIFLMSFAQPHWACRPLMTCHPTHQNLLKRV